jgi:3''-Phosphoadenosine 5''-phosphosulfate (PAPS) 3''-phosphatase
VTAADLAADSVIHDGLAAAFPDIAIVTEERATIHDIDPDRPHFLVDPLDGTKEFVNRRGEFTVNIALIEQRQPVGGVVYAPAVGRLFSTTPENSAIEETGKFELDAAGPTRTLAPAVPGPQGLLVVASKSHRDATTDAYIARYPVSGFKSAGSSLKFCLVAAGEAHLYPRLGRTMEWDTAAGHAVLSAAGGSVIRHDDHSPLLYGKLRRENPFFIAHAPGVDLVVD